MKTATASILILVVIGMFIGVGYSFCVFSFTGSGEGLIDITEKQVNIQEEEMEVMGLYEYDFLLIYKIHDNKDNVTCWLYRGGQGGGISCIPDHLLSP